MDTGWWPYAGPAAIQCTGFLRWRVLLHPPIRGCFWCACLSHVTHFSVFFTLQFICKTIFRQVFLYGRAPDTEVYPMHLQGLVVCPICPCLTFCVKMLPCWLLMFAQVYPYTKMTSHTSTGIFSCCYARSTASSNVSSSHSAINAVISLVGRTAAVNLFRCSLLQLRYFSWHWFPNSRSVCKWLSIVSPFKIYFEISWKMYIYECGKRPKWSVRYENCWSEVLQGSVGLLTADRASVVIFRVSVEEFILWNSI